jgi:hypothetical protein
MEVTYRDAQTQQSDSELNDLEIYNIIFILMCFQS